MSKSNSDHYIQQNPVQTSNNSQNQCVCPRKGNQVINCCGEGCGERIEQLSNQPFDDSSVIQCSCCNNNSSIGSSRHEAGDDQISQEQTDLPSEQSFEIDGNGLANSALEIIKVVDEMLEQATSLKKRLLEMVTQFQKKVCACAEKQCRCFAQIFKVVPKSECSPENQCTRSRAGGGLVPDAPPSEEGPESNGDEGPAREQQQNLNEERHNIPENPPPDITGHHDQSHLSQNPNSEFLSNAKSSRSKHNRRKAQTINDNTHKNEAGTSGERPRGGATKEHIMKCTQKSDQKKPANKLSLQVGQPALAEPSSTSSVGMARSTAEMDLRATLPLPAKQMKTLSPDDGHRSRGGQETLLVPRSEHGTVRIGDITRRLISIQQEIQHLRDEVSKLSCESVCPKKNTISSSENILDEIMSSNLIGKAEEIKQTLNEIKSDCYNKLTPSTEFLSRPGEKRVRERIEREIKRNKPGFSRTINQVKVTTGAKIREENMHRTQFDQTYETNIDTQAKNEPNPINMVFKVSKKKDETIRNPHANDESRKTLKQLKKVIKTDQKAIDEEDTTKEQEQKIADKRIIETRRKVVRTELVPGREPLKEVLINVQINRTIDDKTGEITETTQELGNELSINTFHPSIKEEQSRTMKLLDTTLVQPSTRSTATALNPLFYNYSERKLKEEGLGKISSGAPSTLTTAKTKPVSPVSTKVASFFEIIPEIDQQVRSEELQKSLRESRKLEMDSRRMLPQGQNAVIREETEEYDAKSQPPTSYLQPYVPDEQNSRMYSQNIYQDQSKGDIKKAMESQASRAYDIRSTKQLDQNAMPPFQAEQMAKHSSQMYSKFDDQKSVYSRKQDESDVQPVDRRSVITNTQRNMYEPSTIQQSDKRSKHQMIDQDEERPEDFSSYASRNKHTAVGVASIMPQEPNFVVADDQQSKMFNQMRSQLPSLRSKRELDETTNKTLDQSMFDARSTFAQDRKIMPSRGQSQQVEDLIKKSKTNIGTFRQDERSYGGTVTNIELLEGISKLKSNAEVSQRGQMQDYYEREPLQTGPSNIDKQAESSPHMDNLSCTQNYQAPAFHHRECEPQFYDEDRSRKPTVSGLKAEPYRVKQPSYFSSANIEKNTIERYSDHDLSRRSMAPARSMKSEKVPYSPSAAIQKSTFERHSDHDIVRKSIPPVESMKSEQASYNPSTAVQKSSYEPQLGEDRSGKSIAPSYGAKSTKMDAESHRPSVSTQRSLYEKYAEDDTRRGSAGSTLKAQPNRTDNVSQYPSDHVEGPYFYKVQSELLVLTDSNLDRICAHRAQRRKLAGESNMNQDIQTRSGYRNNQHDNQPSSAEEPLYQNQPSHVPTHSEKSLRGTLVANDVDAGSVFHIRSEEILSQPSKFKSALGKTFQTGNSQLYTSMASHLAPYHQNDTQSMTGKSKASSREESYEILLGENILSSKSATRADIASARSRALDAASVRPQASEEVSGPPRASEAISRRPSTSEAASGQPRPSEAASGQPRASEPASVRPRYSEVQNVSQRNDLIYPSNQNRNRDEHREDRLSGGSESCRVNTNFPVKSIEIDCIPRVIQELSEGRSQAEFFVSVITEVKPPNTLRVNIVDKATGDILGFFFIAEKKFEIARNQGVFDRYLSVFVLNSVGAITSTCDPNIFTAMMTTTRRFCNCPCKTKSDSERCS